MATEKVEILSRPLGRPRHNAALGATDIRHQRSRSGKAGDFIQQSENALNRRADENQVGTRQCPLQDCSGTTVSRQRVALP